MRAEYLANLTLTGHIEVKKSRQKWRDCVNGWKNMGARDSKVINITLRYEDKETVESHGRPFHKWT